MLKLLFAYVCLCASRFPVFGQRAVDETVRGVEGCLLCTLCIPHFGSTNDIGASAATADETAAAAAAATHSAAAAAAFYASRRLPNA